MQCTQRHAAGEPSSFEFWFLRDALVSAALERSMGGPAGDCRPNQNFESWSRAELARLQSRFGPSEQTDGVEPTGRVEIHRWQTRDDEIVLRIYPHAWRVSIEGVDRAALRSLALSESERLALLGPTEAGISEVAVAEEVEQSLYILRTAEQSYYSEFGRYVAAGPYPPEPPRGAYAIWGQGEAAGFEELGFAPSARGAICSYAVSVGPEGCEVDGSCDAFTAEAACDRRGDGTVEYWGFVRSSRTGVAPDGRFGMCRGTGVYSPDTGKLIGHDVVGLCRPRGASETSD
jgi:hypothetical protein